MSVVISADSVSKQYLVHRNKPRTLKESLLRRLTGRHDAGNILWALREVSFGVQNGETLGIIGRNGAGKSTLLRLLCGIGRPTSGLIYRSGRVNGILELQSGFHPYMTGRENIRTVGVLNGYTRREVDALERQMIEFAELEDFIDEPIRIYSSGMQLRLAFSAAFHLDPQVLIIDEVFSVGDEMFQKKCLERFDQFKKSGKTLILTSHGMELMKKMCDEVMVMDEGRVIFRSTPEKAVDHYLNLMRERTKKRLANSTAVADSILESEKGRRLGTQEARIRSVRILDQQGAPADIFMPHEDILVDLEIENPDKSDMAVSLAIFDEKDVKCCETFIPSARSVAASQNPMITLRCLLPKVPLLPGLYYLNIGLYPSNWDFIYDYHWQMHSFRIEGEVENVSGIVSIKPVWSVL